MIMPSSGFPSTANEENSLASSIATELAGAALIARGTDVRTIRLPRVQDTTKAGLITPLIAEARRAGAAAYLDDG